MARGRTDAIIAGVNKAGTTSLFVSLSTHPDVAPSSIKETRYFLPPRYGAAAGARGGVGRVLRRRRRPAGAPRGDAVVLLRRRRGRRGDARPASSNPHVLVVLREPVSRAISFFTYQKVRLRFPADYPIADYLAAADRLTPADFDDPDNEKYMAFRGGCYADFLPAWFDVSAPTTCGSSTSQRLVGDPVDDAARHRRRGSASTPRGSPPTRSAPRTAPPGSRTRGSSASRSRATTGSSACCAATRSQAQAARVLLPAQRASRRRSASPTRCAPSSRRATRSRTRGWLSSSTTRGIATPRAGSRLPPPSVPASPRANSRATVDAGSDDRREQRRTRARTRTRAAITAGIATPESLSA